MSTFLSKVHRMNDCVKTNIFTIYAQFLLQDNDNNEQRIVFWERYVNEMKKSFCFILFGHQQVKNLNMKCVLLSNVRNVILSVSCLSVILWTSYRKNCICLILCDRLKQKEQRRKEKASCFELIHRNFTF